MSRSIHHIFSILSVLLVLLFCLTALNAQESYNDEQDGDRISLTYQESIRMSKQNHPDIRLYEFEQQEADIDIEKQLNNKRRTEIIDYQQELMERSVLNKKEDKYDELERTVIERYDGVLLAAERERIGRRALHYSQVSANTAQDSYDRGLIDNISLQRAREQVTVKRQELAEAVQIKRQATYMLLLVLSLPLDSRLQLTDTIQPIMDVVDFDNAVAQLSTNNRIIKLLELQISLNQLLYEASLTNTMQSEHDRELARIALEKSKVRLDKIKQELRNLLIIRHLSIQTKYEGIRTARIQYNVATNQFTTDQDKLSRGILSEDQLQQSEIMMLNMRLNLLNKVSEYNKAVIEYRQMLD